MQRVNPLITLPGLAFFGLLVIGLGTALWLHGGEAFSPGKLSAVHPNGEMLGGFESHADFEHQCELCHQPLAATQDALCRDCHTAIDEQITSQNGLHSIVDTTTQTCRECHPDHRGRSFSPGLAAIPFFDHSMTTFNLVKHQLDYQAAPLDCKECHTSLQSGNFSADETACQDCHTVEDTAFMQNHILDFGPGCLACHDGLDTLAAFNHAETLLPLTGKHLDLMCSSCHLSPAENGFVGLATECAACHTEPELHKTLFSSQCQDCHTPDGWLPAALNNQPFEHNATGFTLERHAVDFAGSPIPCTACHLPPLQTGSGANVPACLDCHAAADAPFMQSHVEQFGTACLDCHDGSDNLHNFDHSSVFVLDGAHTSLDCTACHRPDPTLPPVYQGLGTACANCHAEPDIHVGFFGLECQRCHTTNAWLPARLLEHVFPLDHGNNAGVPSDCQVCHVTKYTEYTCYNCHEHEEAEVIREHREEGIREDELANCMACHPTGKEEEEDD